MIAYMIIKKSDKRFVTGTDNLPHNAKFRYGSSNHAVPKLFSRNEIDNMLLHGILTRNYKVIKVLVRPVVEVENGKE